MSHSCTLSVLALYHETCATHLHGHKPVVDHDFLGEEVGTYCRLVACAELLVDLFLSCEHHVLRDVVQLLYGRGGGYPYILVHQAGLADTAITKDNDLHMSAELQLSLTIFVATLRRTFFLDAIVNVGCVALVEVRRTVRLIGGRRFGDDDARGVKRDRVGC